MFSNPPPPKKKWKNCRAGKATDDNMAHALDNEVWTHTQNM